jgi:thymidylate kinase
MITAEDKTLLEGFAAAGVTPDWIAFSLVSSAQDVRAGRAVLRTIFDDKVKVMAKIETATAVKQVESILPEAEGIMVARGDLGPAVEFVRLPEAQEELVKAAQRAGKVVVVATQILEHFAEVGVPQRSELSGLALLAMQRPDAIMLGKETVYSPRPIESIRLAKEVLTHETRRLDDCRKRVPCSLKTSLGSHLVVAIEGPNGVGKTHLCSLLNKQLGLPSLRGVPAGWENPTLKFRVIRDADWLASAMYFLSGVIEASREATRSDARLQVMDRSVWSTLAVHYAHDPCRMERLIPLLELATDRLKAPDLTIVLEASAATCRRRIALKSGEEQQMDAASPATEEFHKRESEFYHWLAAQWPKVVFLQTDDLDAEAVFQQAAELIRKSF